MNKIIVVCFGLVVGITAVSAFLTGCGSSNSTSPAPVTVTITQPPTPVCGGQLGYVTVGSGYSQGSGYIEAYAVTLAVASKTLDMAIYLGGTVSGNIDLMVYSDSGGSPNTFMDGGAITSPTANSWNVASLTGQLLSAGVYWLAVENQNTDSMAPGGSQAIRSFQAPYTYGIPPLTMPAGTINTSGAPRAILLDTTCN